MIFTGSPIKAQNLPSKRKHIDTILDDPRPAKYRNMKGYNDHVRNTMVNYCSSTSMDIQCIIEIYIAKGQHVFNMQF
jgi:hypothetical protein